MKERVALSKAQSSRFWPTARWADFATVATCQLSTGREAAGTRHNGFLDLAEMLRCWSIVGYRLRERGIKMERGQAAIGFSVKFGRLGWQFLRNLGEMATWLSDVLRLASGGGRKRQDGGCLQSAGVCFH